MSKSIHALHIGWITDSLKTVKAHLDSGINIKVINTQPRRVDKFVPEIEPKIPILSNLYEGFNIRLIKILRFSSALFLGKVFLSRLLSSRLNSISKDLEQVDYIFANWGVGVLPEVLILKYHSSVSDKKILLNVETFPTAWKRGLREKFEIWFMRKAIKEVDALIIPTKEIEEVFSKFNIDISDKKILRDPFYFPSSYTSKPVKSSTATKKRDLVFLGQLDYSRSLNDVRSQLLDIANTGVNIFVQKGSEISHQNIHHFNYFDGGELLRGDLVEFVRSFKACLVTYNINESVKGLRYETSLPSRFIYWFTGWDSYTFAKRKIQGNGEFFKNP